MGGVVSSGIEGIVPQDNSAWDLRLGKAIVQSHRRGKRRNDKAEEQPERHAASAKSSTLDSGELDPKRPKYRLRDIVVPEYDEAGKKYTKGERKRLKRDMLWDLRLEERRAKRKQKRKDAQARAKNRGSSLTKERKAVVKMASEQAHNIHVVVDLEFEDKMILKDNRKLAKQCKACYAVNRRAERPMQLHLTSFGGIQKEILDKDDISKWDIHVHKESYSNVFPKDRIVYLSSDSENVLDELQDGYAYIIGGLVDHNGHKGLCHTRAVERGISHARLPIDEYIQLSTRRVLTVNHVFEILTQRMALGSWKDALLKVIPPRKGAREHAIESKAPLDQPPESASSERSSAAKS